MTTPGALTSSKPDFNKLPTTYKPPKLHWSEQQQVRDRMGRGLAMVSVGSFLRAGHIGYTQSIREISFYGFLAVAVGSMIVAFRCFSSSPHDPQVVLSLRQKAGREIASSPDFKFSEFFQNYKGLLDKGILHLSDGNFRVERDVTQLEYGPFIEKHAGKDLACKRELIKALSPSFLERLRTNCRTAFALDSSLVQDAIDKELLENVPINRNLEALRAKDWDSFIAKCNNLKGVTDPQALENLKTLFLEKTYEGAVHDTYLLDGFPKEMQEAIRNHLKFFQMELFAEGKLDFDSLYWHKSDYGEMQQKTWESLKEFLEKLDPVKQTAAKEKLRTAFLVKLTYQQINSEVWSDMRTTLGITPEMIESMQGSVRSDCDTLPYLGEGGFRRKYGTAPLKNGALQPQQLDKIKKELREVIPTAAHGAVPHEVWCEELELLKIHDEILCERWAKKSLAELWPREQYIFFKKEAVQVLGADNFLSKFRALPKAQIFQIVKDYQMLFPEVLQPSVIFSEGKTFAQCVEEAVAQAGSLSKDVVAYEFRSTNTLIAQIPLLFRIKLLSPSSPALRALLRQFLLGKGKEILEPSQYSFDTDAMKIWKEILNIPEIASDALKRAYADAYAAVSKAKQAAEEEKKGLWAKRYEPSAERQALQAKLTQAKEQLKKAQEAKSAIEYQERYSLASDLRQKGEALSQHKHKISALQSNLKGLPQLQTSLQAQIATLGSLTAPDNAPLIKLTSSLVETRRRLEQPEQEYKELHAKDPEVQRLKGKIEEAKDALNKAQEWERWKKEPNLSTAETALDTYIQKQFPVPPALVEIRAELRKQEEEQLRLIEGLEVWNRRSQTLEELSAKVQGIPTQIDECQKKLAALEKELPGLQEAYDQQKRKTTEMETREKALQQQIKELEASVKKLDAEFQTDRERYAFDEVQTKAQGAIEQKYKDALQKQIDTLMKMVAPEETTAAV